MRGRRLWMLLAACALWLLALPALAQTGSVRIDDPDERLAGGESQVRAAAERLAATGADVVVIAAGSSAGSDQDSAQRFLDDYLAEQQIAGGIDDLNPDQIVFYAATDARITALFYGSRWKATLDPVSTAIRNEQMNPRFADGDLPGGFVAGIDAARATISPSRAPFYAIGGVLVAAAAGAAAYPALKRRRATADQVTTARQQAQESQRSAGAAIADLGRLIEQAQAKAAYDRLSYSAADQQRIQAAQARGLSAFQEAQQAYDEADEQQAMRPPTKVADFASLTQRYDRARDLAQQASASIREAEALRAQLDSQGPPATGPTQRL